MNKICFSLTICFSMLFLTACNTFQGMGEDLGAAGQTISKTAEKAKPGKSPESEDVK